MKPVFFGNWKMNMTINEASLFMHRLEKKIVDHPNVEAAVCPTSLCLASLAKDHDGKKIKLGAQNVHHADHGTCTGEISAHMVKDLVDFAIVGHSDRRIKFHETDDEIARKMAACLRNGVTPVLCVGEDLMARQNEESDLVLHDQVVAALAMLTDEDLSKIVIAYEPLWAISSGDGQGEWAKPDIVLKATQVIRSTVSQLYAKKA